MGYVYLSNGLSHPLMTCLGNIEFNSNYVSRYITSIILYLILVHSSTWHSNVTIFISMNSVSHTFTFTLFFVARLTACVFHFSTESFSFWFLTLVFSFKHCNLINFPLGLKRFLLWFDLAYFYVSMYNGIIMIICRFYMFRTIQYIM